MFNDSNPVVFVLRLGRNHFFTQRIRATPQNWCVKGYHEWWADGRRMKEVPEIPELHLLENRIWRYRFDGERGT